MGSNKVAPVVDSNICLMRSILITNRMPNIEPDIIPTKPKKAPAKTNILIIELRDAPIALSIAMLLYFSLTNIASPEIMLNAAIIIISTKIKNIVFRSTLKALIND